MLNKIKKYCRKNKTFYFLSRIIYIPIRELFLIKPKREYRNEAIRKLENRQINKSTIFYFGVPVHKNLGDLAQTYCALRYFTKYWPDYEVLAMQTYSTYSKKYLKLLKQHIRACDLIFFQSGYCTTDEHLDHTMHKIILKQFPNTRIVFLPQTVLFRNMREREATSRIFNQHKHTMFLARDDISYEFAKELFSSLKLECFPDIVTTLIGTEKLNEGENSGVLICVRNDYEQLYSKKSIGILVERLSKITSNIDITDTTCNEYTYKYIIENLETVIYSKINSFRKYEVVITDRYHGTIFALIANVPVIVLSSKDHKVSTGLDWFKGVYDGMVYSAKSIENAYEITEKILRNKLSNENQLYFEQAYYAKLRAMVGEL